MREAIADNLRLSKADRSRCSIDVCLLWPALIPALASSSLKGAAFGVSCGLSIGVCTDRGTGLEGVLYELASL